MHNAGCDEASGADNYLRNGCLRFASLITTIHAMIARFPRLLLSVTILCSGLQAAADPAILTTGWVGIMCPNDVTVGRKPAPGTFSGWVNELPAGAAIQVQTREVPYGEGIKFGLQYTLSGTSAQRHPEVILHHPVPVAGRQIERWHTAVSYRRPGIVAHTLGEDTSAIYGDWTFEIHLGGRVQVRETLTVVPPRPDFNVQTLCNKMPEIS